MHEKIFISGICLSLFFGSPAMASGETPDPPMNQTTPSSQNADYQQYLVFFEKVYSTMDENYFMPVKREGFDRFLEMFNAKIYSQLKGEGKTSDFIKWRSSAYLIDFLKSPDDIFSAFFPPQAAKTYEQTVLGKRVDLGIEGRLVPVGYMVTRMEPRSDAFLKGLRERHIILKIDETPVGDLTEKDIQDRLTPLEGAKVALLYLDPSVKEEKTIEVVSQEYFKQTVFMVPVDVPGIYCLQIQRFNQKTSEDMTMFMSYILKQGDTGLVIDLRGNPGGPPLAAREISAFFLPPKEEFAYFQKRNQPKASLDVPAIPERFHYKGPIAILVNKASGSASELFTGILQDRGRAVVMGANTAGQVFLKSMFPFEDESMLLLVTARGHYPDGKAFSFDGVVPDEKAPEDNIIRRAAEYLAAKNKNRR